MRVLHAIPSIGPFRGGPSAAVLAMTRALEAAGVRADIVTTNDNGPATLPVATGALGDYTGCRVCFLPRWSPPVPALREFQFAADFSRWFNSALAGYDGVHVHAVFSYLSTRAMQLCRRQGRPYIVRPLGQLDTWSLKQKLLKKQLYYLLAERANLRAAAAIHCTSVTEAANVRALLPHARTEVIPHGIEPCPAPPDARAALRRRWSLPEHEPVILFLSRWAPKKNIPLLLEALGGMREAPWRLMLAGSAEDGYARTVQAAINAAGLRDRVILPGHVQGEEKALLLHGADVFVLPSITENFGVAVAEALCCGLPCVVSEGVDIAPEVLELGGGMVTTAEAGALRTALRQQMACRVDRASLAARAAARFSWDRAAGSLQRLYTELFTSR